MGQPNYRDGFALSLQPHMLELPLRWKKPQVIFVNSMSDLFHDRVPVAYIQQVFGVMRAAHWHRFQVLTKRAERLAAVASQLPWPEQVWMGVSIEEGRYRDRIDLLRSTAATVRFLSLEPLLGPLPGLDLTGDRLGNRWGRVGTRCAADGSGVGARSPRPVPGRRGAVLLQAVGRGRKKRAGRLLEGRTWDDMPAVVAQQL